MRFVILLKVVFFLFLVLEAEAKRLDTTDALVPLDSFKITLVETCKYAALCPNFVSSKIAQVMAVSFTKLYPKHWPDFFDCLIQCGPDILLSTLIQIDGEVVNRRIHHTKVFRLWSLLCWALSFLARARQKYTPKRWNASQGRWDPCLNMERDPREGGREQTFISHWM